MEQPGTAVYGKISLWVLSKFPQSYVNIALYRHYQETNADMGINKRYLITTGNYQFF